MRLEHNINLFAEFQGLSCFIEQFFNLLSGAEKVTDKLPQQSRHLAPVAKYLPKGYLPGSGDHTHPELEEQTHIPNYEGDTNYISQPDALGGKYPVNEPGKP